MTWLELSEVAAFFFLVFSRIFAMLSVVPLLSSRSIPTIARIALSFLSAVIVVPLLDGASIILEDLASLQYLLLLIAEILIGIVQGFFILLILAAFQTAGQFFSIQMGFGASAVFDPLAQEEVPLLGQFFNLIALFVFIMVDGFQRIFISGVIISFQQVRAENFLIFRESFWEAFVGGLSLLFRQALSMSFPIFGTLLLVSLTMGLLAKAAPQMNLLILGFPVSILIGFVVLALGVPLLINTISAIFENAFNVLDEILMDSGG